MFHGLPVAVQKGYDDATDEFAAVATDKFAAVATEHLLEDGDTNVFDTNPGAGGTGDYVGAMGEGDVGDVKRVIRGIIRDRMK